MSRGVCVPGTASDTGDLDPHDLDAIDERDSTDVAEVGDISDEDGGGDVCEWLSSFDHSSRVWLFEPCAPNGPHHSQSCHSTTWANETGASSLYRAGEPVEVELLNGILDESVVNYWSFNTNLDGSTNDPALEHGVVPPLYVPGFDGQPMGAVSLDSSMVLEVDSPDLLDRAFEWTVMFFVKASREPVEGDEWHLIYYGHSTADMAAFEIWVDSGSLHVKVAVSESHSMHGVADDVTLDESWTHIALSTPVRLPADLLSFPMVYVDGRPVELDWNVVGSPSSLLLGTNGCYIGRKVPETSAFPGAFDELVIFDRALTAGEIAAYVHSERPFATSFTTENIQADYDDLAVTRQLSDGGAEATIDFEVLGVRPHSDQNLEDVLAYWPLDGNVMTNLVDSTTLDVVGTTSVMGRFGDRNGARSFLGHQVDYVDTMFSTPITASDNFTIEMWLNATHIGEFFGFYTDEYGSRLVMSTTLGTSGFHGLTVEIVDTAGGEIGLSFDGAVSLQWRHIAVVRNGNLYRLLVDGVQVALASQLTLIGAIDPDGDSYHIGGANNPSASMGFGGQIDDVLIHGRALSVEEIRRRAQPRLPTLRFLADTASTADGTGQWPYDTYRVYWGREGRSYREPTIPDPDGGEDCLGLLSPCAGYVGWWRFDEGYQISSLSDSSGDPMFFDSSTRNRHATLIPSGGHVWDAGVASPAVYLMGARVAVSLDGIDLDDSFTLEVVSERLEGDISKPMPVVALSDGNECDAARLDLVDVGVQDELQFSYELAGGLCIDRHTYSAGPVSNSDWHHYGVSHRYQSDLTTIFFDNSELTGSWTSGSGTDQAGDWADALVIGSHPEAPESYDAFEGRIDSVRLMSGILSADQTLRVPLTRGLLVGEDSGGCLDVE